MESTKPPPRKRNYPAKKCELCKKTFKPKHKLDQRFCGKHCAAKVTAKTRKSSKGGRRLSSNGYVLLWMPDHHTKPKGGYVMEHRLKAEKRLGRKLKPSEVVLHRNGKKADNRPRNLRVMDKRAHDKLKRPHYTATCPRCGESFPVKNNTRATR